MIIIFASGDYIDLYAEMDLLVGLSACPQGDVSIPCGQHVPEELCLPLKMDVFVVDHNWWKWKFKSSWISGYFCNNIVLNEKVF